MNVFILSDGLGCLKMATVEARRWRALLKISLSGHHNFQ